ncbi:MAG: restriction endonuclease [Gammaproteobacteria bacterium]
MARRSSGIEQLIELPWWLNLVLGAIAYWILRFELPNTSFQTPAFSGLAKVGPTFANWAAVVFGFAAALSFLLQQKKGRLLDRQTNIDSIKELSGHEFEILLSEAFRRQGYTVKENSSGGPDGGIDLILKKDGITMLVQCKNWNSSKVGVTVVRELFGVVMAEGADKGMVVCSGDFTQEAINFGKQSGIQLLGGRELSKMIPSVQVVPVMQATPANDMCPVCGSLMVRRVARRGLNVGKSFLGCSRYPKCRGTR